MSSEADELRFDQQLKQYPLKFVVPEFIAKELTKRGVMPSPQRQTRGAARFYCSGHVIVKCEEPMRVLGIQQPTARGIVRNVSKTGMSFLSAYQFYPCQKLTLNLPISEAVVQVVRCNQVGKGCFDIGIRVVRYATLSPLDHPKTCSIAIIDSTPREESKNHGGESNCSNEAS